MYWSSDNGCLHDDRLINNIWATPITLHQNSYLPGTGPGQRELAPMAGPEWIPKDPLGQVTSSVAPPGLPLMGVRSMIDPPIMMNIVDVEKLTWKFDKGSSEGLASEKLATPPRPRKAQDGWK